MDAWTQVETEVPTSHLFTPYPVLINPELLSDAPPSASEADIDWVARGTAPIVRGARVYLFTDPVPCARTRRPLGALAGRLWRLSTSSLNARPS